MARVQPVIDQVMRCTGVRSWLLVFSANVKFTGLLSARRLAAVFEKADVGLAAYSPNAPQGIPNKIIEYSCAGLAIISSLEGECERLLSESGIGVSYKACDSKALVSALSKWDADRTHLAGSRTRSRALYEERFSAEKVFSAMAGHVETIARSTRGSRLVAGQMEIP